MSAPDDFLSRVQLSAVAALEASEFFATAPAIPVISEVKGDVSSLIRIKQQAGLIAIVAVVAAPVNDRGGGGLVIEEGRLIVRLRELTTIQRGPGTSGETALRAAQAAAIALQNVRITNAAGTGYSGAHFTVMSIEPAEPDAQAGEPATVRAWHVTARFCGGIRAVTRREGAPVPGGL